MRACTSTMLCAGTQALQMRKNIVYLNKHSVDIGSNTTLNNPRKR